MLMAAESSGGLEETASLRDRDRLRPLYRPLLRQLLHLHRVYYGIPVVFLGKAFIFLSHAGNLGRGRAGFNWIPDCSWALTELSVAKVTAHN